MNIYLAGVFENFRLPTEIDKVLLSKYILTSFESVPNKAKPYLSGLGERLMVDSGAFTFMQKLAKNQAIATDFEQYLQEYINFIKQYDIKLFFELDIDVVVGYKKVLEFRKILEDGVGRQCIPVWHVPRGKDAFLEICEQYDYIAIGGIVNKNSEFKAHKRHLFPWFIDKAHQHGAKIHGLGFTNTPMLAQYRFDSVDSTSWLSGRRHGQYHVFNGRYIETVKPKNKRRSADYKSIDMYNYREWLAYQKYMED